MKSFSPFKQLPLPPIALAALGAAATVLAALVVTRIQHAQLVDGVAAKLQGASSMDEVASAVELLANRSAWFDTVWTVALLAVVLGLAAVGFFIARQTRLLAKTHVALRALAEGEPTADLARTLPDDALRASLLRLRDAHFDAQLVMTSLQASRAALIALDRDGRLRFENLEFTRLIERYHDQIVSELGLTEADDLPARLLETLAEAALAQNEIQSAPDKPNSIRVNWGDCKLQAKIHLGLGEDGEKFGYTIELHDVTEEVRLENDVSALIENFKNGDIYYRISSATNPEDLKNQFLLTLVSDLNALLDTFSELFSDIDSAVSAMVAGDVTMQLSGEYRGDFESLKQSLNASISNFETTIVEIRQIASLVADASEGSAKVSSDLRDHAERQKSAVIEARDAMTSMSENIKANADNAERAAELSSETTTRAERGRAIVTESNQAMREIRSSSDKISEITGVIEGIAFQTNLLALNASVEAARAGDAGRGFSVVAEEVRNLAQRSTEAAKSIRDLIDESQKSVEAGAVLFSQTEEALTAIAESVAATRDNVAQITDATRAQTTRAQDVVGIVETIASIADRNEQISEYNNELSTRIAGHASQLQAKIDEFVVSDEAIAAAAAEQSDAASEAA
ncbi:MAG: methyl-accepting chemotaxis protein [Pseudomonadota bacterium]